jgi:hypothetical protein
VVVVDAEEVEGVVVEVGEVVVVEAVAAEGVVDLNTRRSCVNHVAL